MESAHQLARRLFEQIDAEYPKTQLIAGISGPAESLNEWPRVYQEALQAMQLGQRLKMHEMVDFESLGIYRLLGKLEDITAVQEFTNQVIGPLVQYDEQHRSTLVQTIDEYFNHHGNISQTAEALFIHRNTLLYRLDRIQELTGHNLNQANMRLALHLSLKLWQLRPGT
jgi:purine catabolism regulator